MGGILATSASTGYVATLAPESDKIERMKHKLRARMNAENGEITKDKLEKALVVNADKLSTYPRIQVSSGTPAADGPQVALKLKQLKEDDSRTRALFANAQKPQATESPFASLEGKVKNVTISK